jgi:hypothetical protein
MFQKSLGLVSFGLLRVVSVANDAEQPNGREIVFPSVVNTVK